MINCVDKLFSGKQTTMFHNKDIFTIHKINEICGDKSTSMENPVHHIQLQVTEFLKSTYPKQKFIPLFFNIMVKNNLIDDNLFIVGFSNIHLADMASFLNNKFGKPNTTDTRFIKLCKYLQACQLQFPKVSVKNPVAQKYLC